ncbi:MAG: hypothetical protein MUO64_11605 [Anaerolineales bacterium]|nr:hypothetical protein [Anaerolineales bacterium]
MIGKRVTARMARIPTAPPISAALAIAAMKLEPYKGSPAYAWQETIRPLGSCSLILIIFQFAKIS